MRYPGAQEIEHKAVPDWIVAVAKHRDFFKRCVLQLEAADGGVSYLAFLGAVQAPRAFVSFLPLVLEEDVDSLQLALELHGGESSGDWAISFRFDGTDFVWSHLCSDFDEDVEVSVLMDVCFDRRRRVCSDSRWWSWDEVLRLLQVALPRPRIRGTRQEGRPAAAMVEEHPWLMDMFAPDNAARGHRGATSSAAQRRAARRTEPTHDSGDMDIVAVEVDPADVFDELQRRRSAWAIDGEDGVTMHFASQLRGGQWTASHVGEVVDSLRCYAATPLAREWCAAHRMAKSCTLSLRLYGDEVCRQLGDVWMARMSFLMDVSRAQNDPMARLSPAHLEGFRPPDVVRELRAMGARAVQTRLDGMLALRPGYL